MTRTKADKCKHGHVSFTITEEGVEKKKPRSLILEGIHVVRRGEKQSLKSSGNIKFNTDISVKR